MNNCIFSAHCSEMYCDQSCPAFVETSYLLERNNLSFSNPVFSKYYDQIDSISKFIDDNMDTVCTYVADKNLQTNEIADLITYCAICKFWKGSQLHCTVYNLRYSKYLDEIKKSWNGKSDSEVLDYMKIWSESCKILIISNFDFVKFSDFESQTILNLLQSRRSSGYTTILVSPSISNIITGNSSFASMFVKMLKETSVGTKYKSIMKIGGN